MERDRTLSRMATYVLIPGAGSDSWFWHRVVPLLRDRGHDTVTMDLPASDDSAGLDDYLRIVLDAIGDREDLIVVGQSLGGFTAAQVPAHRPVDLLVFLNAMIPAPAETADEWWTNTGHSLDWDAFDPIAAFLHDVPPEIVAESEQHSGPQSGTPAAQPWPLDALPDVPTRAIVARDDRFFEADWMSGVVRDRLGIEPDLVGGSHCVALSRPDELVDTLERIRTEAIKEAAA
jgi:pimeloyl-ACP methyl ester carboxylesterase